MPPRTINLTRHAQAKLVHTAHEQLVDHCHRLINLVLDLRAMRESPRVKAVPRMHWVTLEETWWEFLNCDKVSNRKTVKLAFALFAQARIQGPYCVDGLAWPCAHEAIEHISDTLCSDIENTISSDLPRGTELEKVTKREHEMIDAQMSTDRDAFFGSVPYCTTIGRALAKRFRELRRIHVPNTDSLFGECVWEYLQACRMLGIVGEYSTAPSQHRFDSQDRDASIYRWMTEGETLQVILNRIAKNSEWEPLCSPQSISAAARRFAHRHGLGWPIQR